MYTRAYLVPCSGGPDHPAIAASKPGRQAGAVIVKTARTRGNSKTKPKIGRNVLANKPLQLITIRS